MPRRAPCTAATGRKPDVQPRWLLNALPPATARELDAWIEHIAELPLDAWLRVADRCAAPGQAPLALTRARKRIDNIVASQGLELTAWLVRDLVDGATHRVRTEAARHSWRVRARLSIARTAAE